VKVNAGLGRQGFPKDAVILARATKHGRPPLGLLLNFGGVLFYRGGLTYVMIVRAETIRFVVIQHIYSFQIGRGTWPIGRKRGKLREAVEAVAIRIQKNDHEERSMVYANIPKGVLGEKSMR